MDILDKIRDTQNFTVGGGAASAVAGSKAAGMIGMVANLSLKKDYGLGAETYRSIALEAEELSGRLLEGALDDEAAFCMIKDAFALPKETEFDKRIRKLAIQNGAISAALVPKENGIRCRRVYELGLMLQGQSNPNAGSDLEIAVMLAGVGIKGCIMNIEANLSLIKDDEVREGFEAHMNTLQEDVKRWKL